MIVYYSAPYAIMRLQYNRISCCIILGMCVYVCIYIYILFLVLLLERVEYGNYAQYTNTHTNANANTHTNTNTNLSLSIYI